MGLGENSPYMIGEELGSLMCTRTSQAPPDAEVRPHPPLGRGGMMEGRNSAGRRQQMQSRGENKLEPRGTSALPPATSDHHHPPSLTLFFHAGLSCKMQDFSLNSNLRSTTDRLF